MLKLLLYVSACVCTTIALFYNPVSFNLVVLTAFFCCASAIAAWKDFVNVIPQERNFSIKMQVICWSFCAIIWIAQLIMRIA